MIYLTGYFCVIQSHQSSDRSLGLKWVMGSILYTVLLNVAVSNLLGNHPIPFTNVVIRESTALSYILHRITRKSSYVAGGNVARKW